MLTTEEMRLKSKSQALPVDSSSSSPMVLVVESGNNRRSSTPQFKSSRPCYFARGLCHFGNTCKFVHDTSIQAKSSNNSLWASSSPNGGVSSSHMNSINELLAQLLGQLGRLGVTSPNSGINTTLAPDINTRMNGGTGQVAYQATTSPNGFHIGPSAYYGYPTYPTAQPITYRPPGFLPYPVQPMSHVYLSAGVMPADPTSHMGSLPGCQQPHCTMNFVRDNHCTIKFDASGFSVKDFMTRRVLLRCDSTSDLYPVTKHFPIPHVFLTGQYTWNQLLGHPRSEVQRRLLSSNSISCNKEKPLVLCHACQLGKHVRLPFFSSSTLVMSCFDVVHSDMWTYPILSLSGFNTMSYFRIIIRDMFEIIR
nr:ribonuclease H-like domain-containing protein [Tanacetum cinerariifolium]